MHSTSTWRAVHMVASGWPSHLTHTGAPCRSTLQEHPCASMAAAVLCRLLRAKQRACPLGLKARIYWRTVLHYKMCALHAQLVSRPGNVRAHAPMLLPSVRMPWLRRKTVLAWPQSAIRRSCSPMSTTMPS